MIAKQSGFVADICPLEGAEVFDEVFIPCLTQPTLHFVLQ